MMKHMSRSLLLLLAFVAAAHAAPAAKRAITRPAMADSASVVAMPDGAGTYSTFAVVTASDE